MNEWILQLEINHLLAAIFVVLVIGFYNLLKHVSLMTRSTEEIKHGISEMQDDVEMLKEDVGTACNIANDIKYKDS